MRVLPALAFLTAAALLAGCTEPDQSNPAPPPATDDDGTDGGGGGAGTPTPSLGQGRFEIVGPTLAPADGMNRSLREDDALVITFAVRVPEDAGPTTGFVTLLVNGESALTQNVQLEPGQSREFEHTVDDLRNFTEVHVQARALSAKGEATAPVQPWPRAAEWAQMDGLGLIVHRWWVDDVNGTARVNASFHAIGGNVSTLRVKLLCATPDGAIDESDPAEPGVPQPSAPLDAEMAFPACAAGETTYGIQVTTRDPEGQPAAYARVLFVPPGWPSPHA